ncbi:MAG: peptide chain release factor N(5)-glutamine methyltransferase [Gammaproteobacteria bacterium]|nr:peptide chain release factor N(5)-glutamine methyltransferase [Gammaproteobacteria bacterium]
MLSQAVTTLAQCPSPRLDAEILLAWVLDRPRSWLRAYPEYQLSAAAVASYTDLIRRRAQGEPVAYLRGEQEFWSLALQVTPDTLIPRPETELLVELALLACRDLKAPRIADLGTGSGAVAIALQYQRRDALLVGVDISAAALTVATANARRHQVTVDFRCGHWCEPLAAEAFHLIVANPPYIETDSPWLTQNGLPYEPQMALVAAENGLAALRQIIATAAKHLLHGGQLLLEHGHNQAVAVAALLIEHGYQGITLHHDLAGLPRVTAATLGLRGVGEGVD